MTDTTFNNPISNNSDPEQVIANATTYQNELDENRDKLQNQTNEFKNNVSILTETIHKNNNPSPLLVTLINLLIILIILLIYQSSKLPCLSGLWSDNNNKFLFINHNRFSNKFTYYELSHNLGNYTKVSELKHGEINRNIIKSDDLEQIQIEHLHNCKYKVYFDIYIVDNVVNYNTLGYWNPNNQSIALSENNIITYIFQDKDLSITLK
jgi:hypothetical protein